MSLDKTVQWNTHDMSGGVPVFGFDTKQSFRPAPMDNIADQGGFSQALGLDQISSILTQDIIPRLNNIQTRYPQDINSASARSDTDLWNHLNQYLWGKSGAESSPKGDWAANPNAPIPTIWKNRANVATNAKMLNSLQSQINNAKEERVAIQTKLTNRAMLNHSHASTGSGFLPPTVTPVDTDDKDEDCGWFGEKCWKLPEVPKLSLFDGGLGSLPLYAIGAVGGYFLLKGVLFKKLGF